MSPAQCRAARAWLDWTQQTLALKAKVSLSTIKDFENGSRNPIANNLTAIRRALEAQGMEFTEKGIAGRDLSGDVKKMRGPADGDRQRPRSKGRKSRKL